MYPEYKIKVHQKCFVCSVKGELNSDEDELWEKKIRIDLTILKNKQVPCLPSISELISMSDLFWFSPPWCLDSVQSMSSAKNWMRRGCYRRPYCHSDHLSVTISMLHTRPKVYWKVKLHATAYQEVSALISRLSTSAYTPSEFPPLSLKLWVLSHQMITDFPRSEAVLFIVVHTWNLARPQ